MTTFHGRLRGGATFGEAACAVRAEVDATGDPSAIAAALSFVALGR